MGEAMQWWIVAGLLVAVELVTGTFYLLMLSVGMVAAALAAHAGLGTTTQITVAAVVGGGAVALWHWRRQHHPAEPRATANKDVNLDIGETVQVQAWDTEGQTTVHYRGADWAASLAPGSPANTGAHRIVEVLGSRLVLAPAH